MKAAPSSATPPAQTVHVAADSGAYDIVIGAGIGAEAGRLLKRLLPSKKICIVTDAQVAKLYLIDLMKALEAEGFTPAPPVILPAGEGTKSFEQLQYIIDKCLSYKLDRRSTLIALGGGVIGDITGFAAAVLLRGVPFVQMPTTLLAQVDSSVGGKTAINTAQGKNLVGAFYQPKIVLIDTDTFKTLPARERRAGYAEVVKYALIDNPGFFDWLEAQGAALLEGDVAALNEAVRVSCQAKADIVAKDELETKDIRALLNLGHTFGHALEALGGYDGRLLHGEAVGIGLDLAFRFSVALGLCPAADAARLAKHLENCGMMLKPPFAVTAGEMLAKMRGDKKTQDGRLTLILARGIGKSFVAHDVDAGALEAFLAKNFPGEKPPGQGG